MQPRSVKIISENLTLKELSNLIKNRCYIASSKKRNSISAGIALAFIADLVYLGFMLA